MTARFRHRRFPTLLAAIACVAAAPAPIQAAPDDIAEQEQQAFRAAVARVAPCVVRIETIGGLDVVDRTLLGAGPTTGLIVAAEGYIVSSAFNFIGRPASILVRLPDGSRKAARLVATDHSRQLTLLKIDPDAPLPVPEIAPLEGMRVGQWTIGVGRAFESPAPNVTVGILSAVRRVWGKALQTDAAASPNNYGGPLVDIHGRVLGILAPLSPDADSETAGIEWYDSGIGFAVPAEDLGRVLPRLKKGEDLHAGLLGVSLRTKSLQTEPPVLKSTHPKSPARKAGLQPDDTIVAVNGRPIERAAQLKEAVSPLYAGDRVRLTVLRGKKRIDAELELVDKLSPFAHASLGLLPLRVSALTGRTGATVRYVEPRGPADKAGVKAGDTITHFQGKPVRDPDELREKLTEFEPGAEVDLRLAGSPTRSVKLALGPISTALPPERLPAAREPSDKAAQQRLRTGVVSLKIAGHAQEIWAYVPEKYDPKADYGVVIYLHGSERPNADDRAARWKPLCDAYDLIVAAPAPADGIRWQSGDAGVVEKIIGNLDGTYSVDTNRVVVFGEASGGELALLAGFRYRQQVRGIVAIEAGSLAPPPYNEPAYRMAIWLAHGDGSKQAAAVKATATMLEEAKYPVTVNKLAKRTGSIADQDLARIVRWIDMLDRL